MDELLLNLTHFLVVIFDSLEESLLRHCSSGSQVVDVEALDDGAAADTGVSRDPGEHVETSCRTQRSLLSIVVQEVGSPRPCDAACSDILTQSVTAFVL